VVTICVAGRGWVTDIHDPDAGKIPVLPGEVLVVPANEPHNYGADEKEPWTQLWFHSVGTRADQFLAQLGGAKGLQKGRVTQINKLVESVHSINELRRHGCGRSVLLEIASLAELALSRIYAESCLEPVGRMAPEGEASDAAECARKLQKITTFFQQNFRKELSLGEVARDFHVSESWLYHAFGEHTGFSPLGFVIHLRLQEACRVLATSDRKLEDIAFSVGYGDVFYFSRLFKKHIGVPPSVYRREYAG
jgi:AraC-like DNA-binding protein